LSEYWKTLKESNKKRKEEQRLKKANGNIKDDTLFNFNLNSDMVKRKIIADLSISLNAHPSLNLQFMNNNDLYGNNYLKRIDMKSKEFWQMNGVISCDLDLLEACLNEMFSYYYQPGVFYSVDEGLIRFTGRYCYKQYIPNKPAGEGIKTFAGCDAQTGFCHHFFYRKRFLEEIQEKCNKDSLDQETICQSKCFYQNCIVEGETWKCEQCGKEFCENHCIADKEDFIYCIGCEDNKVSMAKDNPTSNNPQTLKPFFTDEHTTQDDLEKWTKQMKSNPSSDILRLLVNIKKDKKKRPNEKFSPRKIILHFVNVPKSSKYHIYIADSYYGSYSLAQELHNSGHYFIFCCKSDHPATLFKDLLQNDKLSKGEWNWLTTESGKIIALSMHDKKICNFVSNVYGANELTTKKEKKLPSVIFHYNYGMQGVDRYDRHCSNYKISPHRQISWKKAVFLALIKMALVNAYILFKLHTGKKNMTQREYIENILEQYATRNGYLKDHNTVKNIPQMHMILKCTKKNSKGQRIYGNCHCCGKGWSKHRPKGVKAIPFGQSIKSNTSFFCSTCKTWLHPECAYRYYHKIIQNRTQNINIGPIEDKFKYNKNH
jgi:hypothetical protein